MERGASRDQWLPCSNEAASVTAKKHLQVPRTSCHWDNVRAAGATSPGMMESHRHI